MPGCLWFDGELAIQELRYPTSRPPIVPKNKTGKPISLPRDVQLAVAINFKSGTPGMIRTCDPLIRSQVLYPAELRVPKANL